jgi:mannose-1-phosphate guanylyltransferase
MPQCRNYEHRWGVVLAGGEGLRLRSLIRLVSGDDRPKQFCPLLGGATLLRRTRERIASYVRADRTLFVLTRAHEPFYRKEMAAVPSSRMLIQPSNRGTLPAILWSVLHIAQRDPAAVVAFFPSDHDYVDEQNFLTGVTMACEAAEAGSPYVSLLGVPARHAEPGYGWIEAEAADSRNSIPPLLRVKQFWEKPSGRLAQRLLDRGCVWNTFVMIGRAEAFLGMIASAYPAFFQMFQQGDIEELYGHLRSEDFSTKILASSTEQLAVLCLGDVGWNDLGDPQRLIGALSNHGIESPWISSWERQVRGQPMVMQFGA